MDFINKFSDSAKGIARNAKLTLKVSGIKHQIGELEYELGHAVQMKRNELPDEFFKITEIADILSQIDELTQELESLNEQKTTPCSDSPEAEKDDSSNANCEGNIRVCAVCKAQINDGWDFCPSCGEKVVTPEEPTIRICPSCNKELSQEYAFCPFCGNKN